VSGGARLGLEHLTEVMVLMERTTSDYRR